MFAATGSQSASPNLSQNHQIRQVTAWERVIRTVRPGRSPQARPVGDAVLGLIDAQDPLLGLGGRDLGVIN